MTGKIDLFEGLVCVAASDITVELLLNAAASITGYMIKDIIGPSREEGVVDIRYAIIVLAYRTRRMSLPHIASRMGDRDHTTILYAVRVMTARERSGSPRARQIRPIAITADKMAASQVDSSSIHAVVPAVAECELPKLVVYRKAVQMQRGLVEPSRRPPLDLAMHLLSLGWSLGGVHRHLEKTYGALVARDIIAN